MDPIQASTVISPIKTALRVHLDEGARAMGRAVKTEEERRKQRAAFDLLDEVRADLDRIFLHLERTLVQTGPLPLTEAYAARAIGSLNRETLKVMSALDEVAAACPYAQLELNYVAAEIPSTIYGVLNKHLPQSLQAL